MPVLQRSVSVRGPKFYNDGGIMMFVYYYDGSTRDGPRVATHDDMLAYPDALRVADTHDLDAPQTEINDPPPESYAEKVPEPTKAEKSGAEKSGAEKAAK